MTFTYQLNEEDFADFQVYHVTSSKYYKLIRLVANLILPAVFLLAAAYCYFSGKSTWLYLSLAGVGLLALYFFVVSAGKNQERMRQQYLQRVRGANPEGITLSMTLVLDEETITLTGQNGPESDTVTCPYGSVTRAVRLEKVIYLYLEDKGLLLPKRVFASALQEHEFLELLRQKGIAV